MGLFVDRARALSETRFDRAGWLNDDDDDEGSRTPSGVRVNRRTALTVPTFLRGMDILASAVAGAPRDVVIKLGGRTFPEFSNVPRWVNEPNPADPTLTGDDYIYALVASLVIDGNYFVHAYPNILDPNAALVALDPSLVKLPEGSSDFEILDNKGKVIAVDIEPQMVTHLTERAKTAKLAQVSAQLGDPSDPKLAAASVDKIVMLDTWHHVPSRIAYAQKLFAALRAGGALYIVDFTKESPEGPPAKHRLLPEQIALDLQAAGFATEVIPEELPNQYIVRGKKP